MRMLFAILALVAIGCCGPPTEQEAKETCIENCAEWECGKGERPEVCAVCLENCVGHPVTVSP